MSARRLALCVALLLLAGGPFAPESRAQVEDHVTHQRGRLWETVWNYGFIGHPGAWDYLTFLPMGLFPGFDGYVHPCCNEQNAINTFSNANMHTFRGGIWIGARDLNVPGQPPTYTPTPAPYEFFAAGASGEPRGIEEVRTPIRLETNYMEEEGFNPLLPEEMSVATWETNLGLTVTRRSYVWSYPGYRDFIIHDYILRNTGRVVSLLSGEVVPNIEAFQQTLQGVYVAFHGAVSVSTKSQINFHDGLVAVQAGAFGWQPPYHDYYGVSEDGALVYAYNYNGGREPPPFDPWPVKENAPWVRLFGIDAQTPELMSPAAFGWAGLYASDGAGGARPSPAPDVLRIDTHKGGSFQGQDLDMEFFSTTDRSPQDYYTFMTTSDRQDPLGNTGNRFNFFTLSYGPYTVAPGDSLRFVVAEVAGVMDYAEVIRGDPDGHFPDSSIAALERNATLARSAVQWGIGATVDGVPLAADAPEPPPAPETDAVNASIGLEEAVIAVTWDTAAETATFTDGSGAVYYDGATDLDGYRVYRSTDFQYTTETEQPVLRGATWDLLLDIPRAEFGAYFDAELGRYRFEDESVEFGRRYGYYVAAYNDDPRPWTSANGTVVNDLPPLQSGDHRRTADAAALAGPVDDFDVYVVPNPYVFGDVQRSFGVNDPFRIEFRNLPERATIRIYTISGDLIRTLAHGPDERGNLFGTVAWDQKTDSGLLVAPGLYLYQVESETEGLSDALVGKLMIVR